MLSLLSRRSLLLRLCLAASLCVPCLALPACGAPPNGTAQNSRVKRTSDSTKSDSADETADEDPETRSASATEPDPGEQTGAASPTPTCSADNCAGCCDSDGVCRDGLLHAWCGAGGVACEDCTAIESKCEPPVGCCRPACEGKACGAPNGCGGTCVPAAGCVATTDAGAADGEDPASTCASMGGACCPLGCTSEDGFLGITCGSTGGQCCQVCMPEDPGQ